jgi:hypothetical protein
LFGYVKSNWRALWSRAERIQFVRFSAYSTKSRE